MRALFSKRKDFLQQFFHCYMRYLVTLRQLEIVLAQTSLSSNSSIVSIRCKILVKGLKSVEEKIILFFLSSVVSKVPLELLWCYCMSCRHHCQAWVIVLVCNLTIHLVLCMNIPREFTSCSTLCPQLSHVDWDMYIYIIWKALTGIVLQYGNAFYAWVG